VGDARREADLGRGEGVGGRDGDGEVPEAACSRFFLLLVTVHGIGGEGC